MKKLFIFLLLACSCILTVKGQSFKYAFVTDTHVGSPTGEEDLRRTVADLNEQKGIDLVVFTGDITEMGTNLELKLAKEILSGLKTPWYIIPGNHDTGWSESGGVSFIKTFGADKFVFDHKGYRFIACASGPYVRMSDGHIPRDAVVWLDSVLAKTPVNMPIVFLNHYPLDNSLDNWYEAINRLKKYNTQYAICGHGHTNKAFDFEGIMGTMGRSNLRAKDSLGGYNIVTMGKDSVWFAEKRPGQDVLPAWRKIALGNRKYNLNEKFERPSYEVNGTYPHVKEVWTYHSAANVISTPATSKGGVVVFGNSLGLIEGLSLKDGKKLWKYPTGGAIYSSPAIDGNQVILGSGDGTIYALQLKTGKLNWKLSTGASVLGSPVIEKGVAYIGGSDHLFRAIDINTGALIWKYEGLEGAVVSKPLIYEGKVIFGAWDRHLYALDQKTGALLWKWDNGAANRMFSPAMCIPVASSGVVYIAAPDRVLTAIDATTGLTIWRNKEATVRESIGISTDGSVIYGKTMNDDVVAYKAGREDKGILWRLNCGFGYEHVPSMLITGKHEVMFGTRNGVVYAIDPVLKTKVWAHKIDNAMINTVNVVDDSKVLVATMDGKVSLLQTGH